MNLNTNLDLSISDVRQLQCEDHLSSGSLSPPLHHHQQPEQGCHPGRWLHLHHGGAGLSGGGVVLQQSELSILQVGRVTTVNQLHVN